MSRPRLTTALLPRPFATLKQQIVRLKEEKKDLKEELKASVAKYEAKIVKMNTTAARNKIGFDKVTLLLAKCNVELTSQRERNKLLLGEVAGLQARNRAEERQAVRDDANAAKEAAKQAKRSAFKVPANNVSAFLPSMLSASQSGLGTSSYASSPPGMNVWPHQQHQQHQHQQSDLQVMLEQLLVQQAQQQQQQAQMLQQMQQAQQQQQAQQKQKQRVPPTPVDYVQIPSEADQHTFEPTPESARKRKRQRQDQCDDEHGGDDDSVGPIDRRLTHGSASK